MTELITDDLHLLEALLPPDLARAFAPLPREGLIELVLDLGRPPQARYPGRAVGFRGQAVARAELDRVIEAVGPFGPDNRAGIEGTLHRISAIRNRRGQVVGLTLRVGRALLGTIDPIRDLVLSGQSLLLLGRPGVGKTTRLREVARVLADEAGKRVIVVDSSNEIGGDGDVPHPAIGGARRMQVAHPEAQHAVMIEAVENHMPEVIVVDEIGTAAEALACRTIAERGVQLIGTAHGNTLENLVMNPTLADLIGGVQSVVLSDDEARLRGTQKTVSERKGPPTFAVVVEIVDRENLVVHRETGAAVDLLLRGVNPRGERRGPRPPAPAFNEGGPPPRAARAAREERSGRPLRLYAHALSRDTLNRVLRDLEVKAQTVRRPEQADLIIAERGRADDPRLTALAEAGVPVHSVKRNSSAQLRKLLQEIFHLVPGFEPEEARSAIEEVEAAIRRAIDQRTAVSLLPRPARLRQLQHKVAVRHPVIAQSVGSEPDRHLVIHPVEAAVA